VQLHVFVPRFVWLPPDGRSGPHPFVQLGDVPTVHVVTLSVTPPSTASVHGAAAPELEASPLEASVVAIPELEPLLEPPLELVVPELEEPELEPLLEPELASSAPPLLPPLPPLLLLGPVIDGGLLLLLHPAATPQAASQVPRPIIPTESRVIASLLCTVLSNVAIRACRRVSRGCR